MNQFERRLYKEAKNRDDFINAEEYVKQYEQQCKEQREEEEKKLNEKLQDNIKNWHSTLKDVSAYCLFNH